MSSRPLLRCAPIAVARMPLRAPDASAGFPEASDDRPKAMDPHLRTAIGFASPSLARSLDRMDAAALDDPVQRFRIALGVREFRSRATFGTTPYGLFAGVALATFGSPVAGQRGDAHRVLLRPTVEWLAVVGRRLEHDLSVLARCRVWANPSNRYTPDHVHTALPTALSPTLVSQEETRLRLTRPVIRLIRSALRPVPSSDLAEALRATGEVPSRQLAWQLLRTLVVARVLATDIVAAPDAADPLGHLVDRLPADHEHRSELIQARAALAEGAASLTGAGRPALRRARQALSCVVENPRLRADVAVDAAVTLPDDVRVEVQRAADLLWRLVEHPTPPLAAWHRRLLDRFGAGHPVPLLTAMDDRLGIGSPYPLDDDAGRHRPAIERRRFRRLGEIAADAVRDGLREVVLDEVSLDELTADPFPPARSVDLVARLVAASPDRLRQGAFLLVEPHFGTGPAFSTLARFAPCLDAADRRRVAGIAGPAEVDVWFAEVVCTPLGHIANAMATPGWLGAFIDADGTTGGSGERIGLTDLMLVGKAGGLELRHAGSGRRVVPVCQANLPPAALPALARLLVDLGGQVSTVSVWWRPVDESGETFLPRLRTGRIVLRSARWVLPDGLRRAAADDVPADRWDQALREWTARSGVPDRVVTTTALDMTDRLDRMLLRRQCRFDGVDMLAELPGGETYRDEWCLSSDGPCPVELSFPLFPEAAADGRSAFATTKESHANLG
jgi:lantibiotic biosynthesis protein